VTIDSTISFFRRRRTAQFRARCKVERRPTPGTFDAEDGSITPATPTLIYEGPCNVREMAWSGTDVIAGDQEVRLRRAEIFLPHDTPIDEDDVLTVTAATHDADLVGRRFRITDVFADAWQISRRAMGEKLARGLEDW
jgi:hypothetical protein